MKISTVFLTASFSLLVTWINAQTSLKRITLEPFNVLVVKGSADVYVNQTGEPGMSASESDLQTIQYSVKEGTLEINGSSEGHIYIHTQGLSRIELAGNSEVYSSDTLKGSSLSIINSGAGDATLLLNYTDVDVNVTGSADLKLSGSANNLNANISGAGDLRAYKMPVLSAIVKLSGSGDAQINASKSIQGNVAGAGTLYHQGEPEKIEVEVTGAGGLKKSNALVIGDTTRIRFGNKRIIILEKDGKSKIEIGDDVMIDGKIRNNKNDVNPKKDLPSSIWAGFELGINGYLNPNNNINMDSVNNEYSLNYNKSIVVNFNLWEVHARILKNNIYVTSGFGAEINNYRFDKNIKLLSGTTPTSLLIETDKDYDKSKLVTGFLNAPFYLTFATNKFKNGKRLSLSPGITAGWKFTSYNKRVVNENGDRQKSRNNNDFNLNPFRINASVRIGYGSFILFANYAIVPMFQKNEGPDLTAFSTGIRIVGLGKD